MNQFIKHAAAILMTGVLATPAFAAQETFNLVWSGASFGNGASATGQITIDTDSINTSYNQITFPDAQVSDLMLTIIGATSGNGTFGVSDFGFMVVNAPSALDFSKELVGQSLADGSTWGQPNGGPGGDFNLFANNVGAPLGTWYFTLTSADGQGDSMLLTSMSAAVPEASDAAMMFAGLGLMGLVARRRKTRA